MSSWRCPPQLIDGIDAAGMGREAQRPSYKVPTAAQFAGRCAGKRKPADRVDGRVRYGGMPEGAQLGAVRVGAFNYPNL